VEDVTDCLQVINQGDIYFTHYIKTNRHLPSLS